MKKYHLATLGHRLKKLREQKKMTRDILAKQAKVNYNTIIKIESGANQNPTIKTVIRLAQAFKITVEDFLS